MRQVIPLLKPSVFGGFSNAVAYSFTSFGLTLHALSEIIVVVVVVVLLLVVSAGSVVVEDVAIVCSGVGPPVHLRQVTPLLKPSVIGGFSRAVAYSFTSF